MIYEIYICEAVCDAVREWSEVTRPSSDCQTTIFRRFKQLEFFLKKVAERSRDNSRRSRDRRPTVKLDVSSDFGKFWKKSLNGHATVVGGHATVGRLSNNVFWTLQAIWENFEKSRWTVTWQWLRSRDRRPTVKQRFFGRFKQLEFFLKKVAERSRDSGRRSRDCLPTVKQRFFWRFKRFGKILKKVAERSRDSGWGHATVGRLSNNVFWTFQAIWENFEKSRWTVTRQQSEVTRPSADCQIGRFKRFGKILKKVAERSRDTGRRSRDRRPTVKQRFLDVSSDLGKFWKKSLNGHATVVEVTRPSADCQTTFFGRFKQLEIFLKKVAERSRDSGRRSRDCLPTVKPRFFDVSTDLGKFWKKSLKGHATVVEVTRPSADCQTTFFGRFKRFGRILKKVAERSRDNSRRLRDRRPTVKLDVSSDLGKFWKKSLNGHATVVGGHATIGRLSNNVFWTFQAIWENFEKSRWTVTRQWLRSRDRRPTVKQRFLDVSSNWKCFWKKSLNGHVTVVGSHATVGRLSNNVFLTFQAIWENFEKSRWKVTRQWLRSRDRRPTVKQRFLDVSSDLGKFWRKSLNGHATVVGGHATVGRLSNNDFSTFQAIKNFFEKSRWTVTRHWSEVTRPSADCQTTFFGRFKRFGKILKKVAERSRDSGWGHATVGRLSNNVFWTFQAIWENFEKSRWTVTRQWLRSRDRRPTVKQRFLDVSSN